MSTADATHFLAGEYPNAPPADARFQVVPVPLEATVSYGSGTAAGPAAILAASAQLEPFDGYGRPGDAGIHTWPAIECSDDPATVLPRVREAVMTALNANRSSPVPVVLGGEHSITAPSVEAVRDHYRRSGPIGVIQIDAHADLRHEYEGSRLSHACVMRRVHEDLGVPLFQIGVRALCEEEVTYRDRYRKGESPALVWYDAREIVPTGVTHLTIPPDFPQQVYISLDVDGLDPSLCPATGTPVPGGIGWYQVLALLQSITAARRVVGFDVVELAPIRGYHAADYAVAELTYRIMGMITRS